MVKQWGQDERRIPDADKDQTQPQQCVAAQSKCGHPNRGSSAFCGHIRIIWELPSFNHLCIHIAWMLPPSASVDAYLETSEGICALTHQALNVDQIIKSVGDHGAGATCVFI